MANVHFKVISFVLAFTIVAQADNKELLEGKERTIDNHEISEVVSQDEARNGSNTIDPLEYSIKLTMINYGQSAAKVHQRFLFPDGAEVKSFFLGEPNDKSRQKRSSDNQRLTQWDGGSINLNVASEQGADMVYINYPTKVLDTNSKTFHRLSTSLMVTEGDMVGGEIFSPNYLLSYPNGADLTWLIAYPEGNTVRLEMEDFSMEECCDHLIIYDGFNKSHSVLATFDGEYYASADNIVVGTKQAMFLRFTSDCLETSRGFRAKYVNVKQMSTTPSPVMSCGPVELTSGNSGNIFSPNYPGTYDPNMNCTWSVQTYYGTRVKFVLYNFSISFDDDMSVYDGTPSNPGSRIYEFSGSYYSGYTIYANSNRAFIVFTSGYSTNYYNKFVISYSGFDNTPQTSTVRYDEATQISDYCGDVVDYGNSGYVYSPNYPDSYAPNGNCSWSVQTQYGTQVRFQVMTFSVGSDVLYIYNGIPNNPGRLIKIMSGYYSSGYTVTADSNQAFMTFDTDSYTAYGYRFRFYYYGVFSESTTVLPLEETTPVNYDPGKCNESPIFYSVYYSTNLVSPGYYSPNSYPLNDFCIWYITVVSDRPYIHFYTQFFSTEYNYDWLRIYRGHGNDSKDLINEVSGYLDMYTDIGYVYGTTATVTFESDYIVVDTGFRIYVDAVDTDGTPMETTTTASPQPYCYAHHYSGTSGSITSPNYPNDYENNMNCSTYITTPYDTMISLMVQSFNLNSSDHVQVYDASNGNFLGSYYGSHAYGITWYFYTRYLRVDFISDSSGTSSGYRAYYSAIDSSYGYSTSSPSSNCGYQMPDNYGIIYSPSYPNYYSNRLDCIWTVQVYSNMYVLFTLNDFDLESCCDYVALFKGTPEASQGLVAQITSTQTPGSEVVVKDNQAYLTFHTDESINRNGFNISYSPIYTSYVPQSNTFENYAVPEPDNMRLMERNADKIIGFGHVNQGKDLWEGSKNRPHRPGDQGETNLAHGNHESEEEEIN